MEILKWLDLQLFGGEGGAASGGTSGGDGAASGGEGSAATGDNPADAAQARLEALGVPREKIRKQKTKHTDLPEGFVAGVQGESNAQQPVTAAEDTEDTKETQPAKPTWEELLKDPDYNAKMQETVQNRLKSAKDAQAQLDSLSPMLDMLRERYGVESLEDIVSAVSDDNSFYAQKAEELGVDVELVKKMEKLERADRQHREADAQRTQDAQLQQHFASLVQQGDKLKETFPNFSLEEELKNPAFARMTAPGMPMTVEQAYYAIHHAEIQEASMRYATQAAAQQMSSAIQAGQQRPAESGLNRQAASVSTFDYAKATPEQRASIKKYIREKMAAGEKVYPPGYHGR